MAKQETPKFHEYSDALDGKHKVNNYDELLRRAQLKKKDFERTKNWLASEASLNDYVSVLPSKELALAEYYSSMPEVEMEPEIAEFWKAEQDSFKNIDLQGPQKDYLDAYEEWQDYVDKMDQKKRDELGVNNIYDQEKEAKQGIKDAKEKLKEAKQRARTIENEVSPAAVFLGPLIGNTQETKKYLDAKFKGVSEAKKGVKKAEERLASVRERKAQLQERRDEIGVKETMALEKMNDALGHIANLQKAAAENSDKSKKVVDILHKQYEMIDKYKSIQKLKESDDYVSKRLELKNSNKPLFDALEALPDMSSQKLFKITLQGPLQIPQNASKITDIDKKIEDVQKQLPDGVNLNDLENEIQKYKLKDTDTKDSIQEEMDKITDKTSKEYKDLEAKKEYLELKEKYDNCQKEIDKLKKDLVNADPKTRQKLLKKLSDQQQISTIIKDELDKNQYSQTLKKFEELQKLLDEKSVLESQQSLENLESVSTQLETCEFPLTSITLSSLYKLVAQSIEKQTQAKVKQLETKHQKLDIEQQQEQDDNER